METTISWQRGKDDDIVLTFRPECRCQQVIFNLINSGKIRVECKDNNNFKIYIKKNKKEKEELYKKYWRDR